MKDRYDELFSIVCKKGDERLEQRRIVWTKIRNLSAATSGICATIIIGVGIWNSSVLRNAPNNEYDPPVIIETPTTTQTAPTLALNTKPYTSETYIKKTTFSAPDPQHLTSLNSKAINVDSVTSSTTASANSDEKKIVRLDSPDKNLVTEKLSEISTDGTNSYKLTYSNISNETIGQKLRTIEIKRFDSSTNTEYIINADIFAVTVESSNDMIAVRYGDSTEPYLYYADSNNKFSMDWVNFSYRQGYLSCGQNYVDSNRIGDSIECVKLNGVNDFTGENIELSANVFSITKINPDCAVAVLYDDDTKYHLFRNLYYKPETLGQLINDMNLTEEMKINGIYYNDEFYTIDENKVWDLLLSAENAESHENGMHPCDYGISVDISILGKNNIGINIRDDGYINTNIVDSPVSFYIGIDSVNNFLRSIK